MKSKFYSLLFFLFSFLASEAQQKTVTGTVTRENGDPLAGVTVAVKGSKTITLTNNLGAFKIAVPISGNPTLVFTYVGNKKQEILVNKRDNIDVGMVEESSTLNDVVVIGYASVRRPNLTGSVSSISAKDLKDVPVNSAAEALAGRLAGVQVIVSEGSPGADVDIFVRGRNSITQSGSPLYVVDGVQVENALAVISPQDIASIDVLKDAASTAIYGARGSNGVVLITTKGGKNTGGKTTITYNAFAGVSEVSKELDVMDPYNFVLYSYERAKYTENATDTATAAQYIKRMSNYDTIASTYLNYANPVDWSFT